MFKDIKGHETWQVIKKIDRGFSRDTKYYIETIHGNKLLLRTSSKDTYEKKLKEFEMIEKFSKLGFEMSIPLDFGLFNDDQEVFMLLTWVEGEDLEYALPKLDEKKQYELGREAGHILRAIHSIHIPDHEIPQETKLPKKRRQIELYETSEVRIDGDETALKFLKEHIDQIWSKPPVYLHGDYHPGNLILTPDQNIGVIDFNRWEIGDPYEEFYKLESFGTEVSIPYCIGQIEAYFNDDIPNDFWDILAIYCAHSALYSIKWAEPFGQEQIDVMINICKKTMNHFDNFNKAIPSWYRKYD
ncbi:MAG: phosphotransferase [Tenericutes bacterium]|nr:phosphotransferase [Mycoplasmatota bacterium]